MPRKKIEVGLVVLAVCVIGYIAVQMLFVEQEVSPPAGISSEFSYHVNRMSLQVRVVDKVSGRSVFWFNTDSGPSPRSIERLPNGDWTVVFAGKR